MTKRSPITSSGWFHVLMMIIVLLALVACGTPQKEFVSKPQVRLVETPRHLLEKCAATVPPARDSFVAMSEKQQVDVLSTYSSNLLGDLKNCNDQITGIATYQANQRKVVEDANKDVK